MAMPPVGLMGGLQTALAAPGMMQGFGAPAPQQGGFQPKRMPGGFLNVLGQIGDVLAVMGGRNPMYAPWRQQREMQNAYGEWANNPDDPQTRANFLGMGGADAWKAMQDRLSGQNDARKLALEEKKLAADANNPELVVIDGVAFDKRTGQPKFESPYTRIIPGPDGSFYEQPRVGFGRAPGGGSPPVAPAPTTARQDSPVRVKTPDEARALPPGTLFMTPDGRTKRVPGGAGSGPRPFP